MATLVKVTTESELTDGQGKAFNVNGRQIAIVRKGGDYYALQNICPHKGGPVGEGEMDGTVIACPWHGWEFDLAQGGVCTMNEKVKVQTYPVKNQGGEIFVEV